jgi:uncharacterized protein YkwD
MKNCRFAKAAVAGSLIAFIPFIAICHAQVGVPRSSAAGFSQPSHEEKLLLDSANRERAAAGLQPLKWDGALAAAAFRHAEVMAREHLLSHQYPGEAPLAERAAQAGARFASIAENIALGPNAAEIHDGWMHSPGHRRNILNGELTSIGIATLKGSDGLFAVQDFSRPVPDLSIEQQEEKVVSLLRRSAFLFVAVTEDARKACRMNRGFTGSSPSYTIRFEVTDLSKLPDQLLEKARSHEYRRASVGACGENDTAGFTRFRIAVILN